MTFSEDTLDMLVMFVIDKTRAAENTCLRTPIRYGSLIVKLLSKAIQNKKEIED